MKKTIFVVLIALLLVSSIASAGFWDKLTGNAFFNWGKKANTQAAAASTQASTDPSVQIVRLQCGERLGQFATTFVCRDNRSVYVLNATESFESAPGRVEPAKARVKVLQFSKPAREQWINEGASATLNGIRVTIVDLWSGLDTGCGAVVALKCMELRAAPRERIAYWSGMFGR
ncbi:MAG TPA: hypothetical protein HA362_03610 [Nanoarchaeota archaeon]|nr:hypothetical protein [Nanoarchaeota archaeon]